MRQLKLQVQISIDGFVAGPNGELDWIFNGSSQDPIIQIADTCDTILMGRKMASGFTEYWEGVVDNLPESAEYALARRMVDMRKIVFSHTLTSIGGRNVELANGDLAATVQALKQEPGKDIIVYGGASFVSSLIEQDLIDVYHMFTIPVALGDGLRIFKARKNLQLTSSISDNNQEIINTFIPVR
ncbi:dihydrofolate reductase [Chitinophaga dinghuensis]|uniref:Dihydrofolate reductase n=1 Tax=Chitinophaga dinghuensis TaxID=1539050 RepID=A0A327VVY5_9BACT|nr:dihydrofolate reductase family protein [Chitinophaga dinghuensis]RAJ78994.1 dihydrofolate reductase [Chitinophaga dinghuensis]